MTSLPLASIIVCVLIAYLISLVVYRLVFHPLAKFPGPRLAGATSWYEAYYEIVQNGQYSKKISRLHDQYGPVVRVTPHEIHIRDSRFFEHFYPTNVHLHKEGWDKRFGSRESVLTTVDAQVHKRRRAALNPMFSRRSIMEFRQIIDRHVDTLERRFREFESRKEPVNLTHAFPALTGDVIMDYFFGFNYAQLKNPAFESFHEAFTKIGGMGHIATQFPAVFPQMRELIARTLRGEELGSKDAKRTIFREILDSKLPPPDKTQQRFEDEAQIVIGAGVATTAYALAVAAFHITDKLHIYDRLHADLVTAFPMGESLELVKLEQMPYLKACIMEAVRLTYGLSARNPRTHDNDIRYKTWVIPAGTCVSMSNPDVSHDEDIFPQSHEYIPERWLNEPKTSDGVPLDRFMVSFGRGTRSCLGITLASAELHLTLGMMFRSFKFDILEPDVTDVEMAHDFFIPVTRLDSKGVRVFVTSMDD